MITGKINGSPEILIKSPRVKFVLDVDKSVFSGGTEEDWSKTIAGIRGPLDPVEVARHMECYKLSWICAHCIEWYKGRDKKLGDDKNEPMCTASEPCGGVSVRMGYPAYRGPLSREEIKSTCAVCGATAPKHAVTPDGNRTGYCLKHLEDGLRQIRVQQLVNR